MKGRLEHEPTRKAGCTASIDIAIATAERLVHLQFEAAKATNAADKDAWKWHEPPSSIPWSIQFLQ